MNCQGCKARAFVKALDKLYPGVEEELTRKGVDSAIEYLK